MGIQFTTEQVLTMAPDSSSAAAGKKLGVAKHWKNLGQSSEALWGECQGSALYQVRVDLSSLTIQCSCPSRKLPCKHGLGLLLLTVNAPTAIPVADPPEWIVAWLAKRAAASKRKEETEEKKSKSNAEPTAAQIKNAEKRMASVTAGIEHIDLWLNDLVRNGLGSVETQPAKYWETPRAQMQDAQATGIALRIQRMAAIPNASRNWPEKLLAHMGQLALLTHAFNRLDQLEAPLQEDVRQLIGWSLKEDEVIQRGERVTDDWLTLGQLVEEGDRGRTQRTWLLGTTTKRSALVLQFAITGVSFSEVYPLGIRQTADLVYWPSAYPQRALIETRRGEVTSLPERLPGTETIEEFFESIATVLARHPWRDRFLCTLRDVIPIYDTNDNTCYIRDSSGQALRLVNGEHWHLLARSGGMPVDFAGEWDGEVLTPLGILVDGKYYTV